MVAYLCWIVLVVGLLMYLLCSNGKAQELGRMMFFAAAVGLMVAAAPPAIHLLR